MQPPASLKALGDPIYETFYGLTEQPFAITTDPRFFYLSASHQRAFSELLNGLRRRESLLLLTGDTGTGKTTLCRAVLEALGDRTFSAIILNPYMSGAEVLRIILRDFGLVTHEELRRGSLAAADVPQLLDTLEGFLQSLIPLGSYAVVIMDEAQALQPAVLDQIRLLTALESGGRRLLQVVLCGQPGLLTTIKAESLNALNERITRRVELKPLPADEIHRYIEHRLGVAGGLDAVSFDASATQAVADLSRGLPRRVNVLCDRALQEGRIEGVTVISADLVKRAARALAGVHDPLPAVPTEPVRTPKVPVLTPEPVALHETAPMADAVDPASLPASDAPESVRGEISLSFGQEPATESNPTRSKIVLGVAGVLAVLAIGYGVFAWQAGAPDAVPAPPPGPVRNTGMPAGPIAVPTPAEMLEMFPPVVRRPLTPPPGETPDDQAPPVPVAPVPAAPTSGQAPENGNQLN